MFSFSGINKIIQIDAGVSNFVAQDLYEAWKDWTILENNSKYVQAMLSVGGDEIGSGQKISPYFFLINGWMIRPQEANHTLVISGNLLATGGGSPFLTTIGNYNVRIISQVTSNSITHSGSTDVWNIPATGFNSGTVGDLLIQTNKNAKIIPALI